MIGKAAKLADSRIRKKAQFDYTSLKFILKKPQRDIVIPMHSDGNTWLKNGFKRELPFVLFVSGWTTTPEAPLNLGMAEAYNCRGGVNFVVK